MQLPVPAEVKRYLLARTLVERKIRTFVETGTFHGDTVAAVLPYVDEAWTFEVDEVLVKRAKERFVGEVVVVVSGDTACTLPNNLRRGFIPPGPALFWLDAHWMGPSRRDSDFAFEHGPEMARAASGDTPIEAELRAVLDRGEPNDIIVIDDARYFGMVPTYPRVSELILDVARRRPLRFTDVVLDMIWIGPPGFNAPTRGIRVGEFNDWGCPFIPGMVRP